MGDHRDARIALRRITTELVTDICALSDEELFAEVSEAGSDVAVIVTEVDKVVAVALQKAGKARLAKARTELNTRRPARSAASLGLLSAIDKERVLTIFAANDGTLRERLTMAARSGEAASEVEMDSILRDLFELGAIDEWGNPR